MSIFIFSSPSYSSGISSNANSASCDNSTLEKYTGTSNLTAGWTGNHIDLYWYADSEATTPMTVASESQDCTYGGSLTPPAASSMVNLKPGYTFRGWRVRDLTCGLSHVDTSIGGTWYASKGSTGYCYYYNVDTEEEVDDDCSDSHVAGLNNSGWETNFSYGTVKGTSYCSGLSGNNNNLTWSDPSRATESELTSASGEKKYCWCAATSYTPDGGTQCNIASPSWVFLDGVSASYCAYNCANDCANGGLSSPDVRRALYGITQ